MKDDRGSNVHRKDESYVSIYVRNKSITPSSYYRIIQYTKYFEGNVRIREIAPLNIYQKQLNLDKNKIILKIFIGVIYYIIMMVRCLYFLAQDYFGKPKVLIVSKTFCPKYTPVIIRALIKRVCIYSKLYWDFDDHIFINGEISKKQSRILEKYSTKIIVTNNYLKSKISEEYQGKVLLLPTTDGDLQGFDEKNLIKSRLKSFENEIRLVWVATSVNIIHLEKIVKNLDHAAKILKTINNKNLILTVVCNKKFEYESNDLIIKNIVWSRENAKTAMYNAHIGIMPLIMNEFSKGKGGFKLIQYISTGLPIIASKVGFNEEIVTEDCGILVQHEIDNNDWEEAILKLTESKEKWLNYSKSSYKRWKDKFDFEYNLKFWQEVIKD